MLYTYLHLDGYLGNLANVARQEKTTLMQLADHCMSLSTMVASLTAGLILLTSGYALLMQEHKPGVPGPTSNCVPTQATTPKSAQKFKVNRYCWMHCY